MPLERFSNVPHRRLGSGWRFCECTGSPSAPKMGTYTAEQIEPAYALDPEANIGVVTGAPSGVLVIDIDNHGKPGFTSWAAWYAEQLAAGRKLPDMPEVWTPSGGQHRWLALPPGRHVKTVGNWLDGVDIKACGGQVAVPPSRRIVPMEGNGETWEQVVEYEWWSLRGVPLAPDWFLEDVASRRERGRSHASGRSKASGGRLPSTEKLLQTGFEPGYRDTDCHRLACRLIGRLDNEQQVAQVIHDVWRVTPGGGYPVAGLQPFTWDEAEKCMRSARRFIERQRADEARQARALIGGWE